VFTALLVYTVYSFNQYGWHALLIVVVGEMLIPIILAPFYKGYSHTTMAISTLGNSNSPVRLPFNLWMLIVGLLLLGTIPVIYNAYYQVSKPLITVSVLFIAILLYLKNVKQKNPN
jgi:hypothetical membrane protein